MRTSLSYTYSQIAMKDTRLNAKSLVPMLLISVLSFSTSSIAHGPGLMKIEQLSRQIAEQGKQASLFIQRAGIYRNNQHWQEAMADLDTAAQIEPDNVELEPLRAEILFSSRQYQRALDSINLYLRSSEATVDILLIRARSCRELGLYKKAVQHYKDVLSKAADKALSEWYVEYSNLLIATDDKPQALQILQAGISVLGSNSVFQTLEADLEVELGQYNSALARIDRLARQSQRKDIWLSRRGDILSKAGQQSEALSSYQQAYAAFQQLPIHIRNQPVSRELKQTLQARLDI